jgi:LPXTG-motif cell wall-anchored protein
MKGPIRWLVAVGAGVILSITGVSFAHAAEVTPSPSAPPNCKTVVSDMAARPDSGVVPAHWADDKIHRVVKICVVEDEEIVAAPKLAPVKYWSYAAVGTDTGTFTTVGNKSPQHGWPMKTGAKGTLSGNFSLRFTAPANWAGFSDSVVHNSSAYSTSEWLAKLWTAEGYEANDKTFYWKWTYKLCEQFWVNSVKGNAGDITGFHLKRCPSPSPSVSPSASTGGGATPTSTPTVPGLPVTGPSNIQWVAMTGGAMIIAGAVALVIMRRRRSSIRFTA